MITEIEIAKSSQSTCQCCKQIIRKDELRGIEKSYYPSFVSKKYYCISCSLNILHSSEKLSQKLIKKIINYVENKS